MLCRAGFSGNGFSLTGRTVIWCTGDCVLCCVVLVLVESDSLSCTGRSVIWSTGDCVLYRVVLVLVERDLVVQVGL